jgi:hypothetical protein
VEPYWKHYIIGVVSMYNVLIQPDFTVHNNLKFWKMKIPLKSKVFTWYLHRGMILTKDNFAKCNWQGSKKSMSFIIMTILFNLYSFSANMLDLYGQPSRSILPCTDHIVLRIYSATCSMVWIIGLNYLLGWVSDYLIIVAM